MRSATDPTTTGWLSSAASAACRTRSAASTYSPARDTADEAEQVIDAIATCHLVQVQNRDSDEMTFACKYKAASRCCSIVVLPETSRIVLVWYTGSRAHVARL